MLKISVLPLAVAASSLLATTTATITFDATDSSTLDGNAITSSNSIPGTNWEVDNSGDVQQIWIKADGSNSPIDCTFSGQFETVWTPVSTENPQWQDDFQVAYIELDLTVESSINGSGTGYVKDE